MKKLLLFVSMMILSLALVACGGEEKGNEEGSKDSKNITGSATAIAEKIVNDGKFNDEVVTIDADMAGQKLDIDMANVEESVCYWGTGDSANMVYVAVFKEASQAEAAKEKLEVYLDELKTANESYDPEEVDKIDNAIVEINGKYAILVISDDNDAAQKNIDSFKK